MDKDKNRPNCDQAENLSFPGKYVHEALKFFQEDDLTSYLFLWINFEIDVKQKTFQTYASIPIAKIRLPFEKQKTVYTDFWKTMLKS